MGHLLTLVQGQLFQCCQSSTILQLFRTYSIFSSQPQWWFKQWHQCLDPTLDFDRSHHISSVFLTGLSPTHFFYGVVGHHIKDCGALVFVLASECAFWDGEILSWKVWMLCVPVWSPRGQASTLIAGIWGHHNLLQGSWEICFPKQRVQRGFLTLFSFVLFLWCLAAKLHITGNQNLFSPWLTVV